MKEGLGRGAGEAKNEAEQSKGYLKTFAEAVRKIVAGGVGAGSGGLKILHPSRLAVAKETTAHRAASPGSMLSNWVEESYAL